jgi:Lrp/AsnC family leucine-responsive transcriptional regulator
MPASSRLLQTTARKSRDPCSLRFAKAIQRAPEVLECYMVAGGFDYLVKTRLSDMTAYRRFLGDVLLPLPGVKETRTYAVMEEVKSYAPLPL